MYKNHKPSLAAWKMLIEAGFEAEDYPKYTGSFVIDFFYIYVTLSLWKKVSGIPWETALWT